MTTRLNHRHTPAATAVRVFAGRPVAMRRGADRSGAASRAAAVRPLWSCKPQTLTGVAPTRPVHVSFAQIRTSRNHIALSLVHVTHPGKAGAS